METRDKREKADKWCHEPLPPKSRKNEEALAGFCEDKKKEISVGLLRDFLENWQLDLPEEISSEHKIKWVF